MNYLPNEKDLESLRNKELIALLKNAFMEFAEKPYNNLHVTDMPHLRPVVLRLREKELIELTIELLSQDQQMHKGVITYLYRKYITRLAQNMAKTTLLDECFRYYRLTSSRASSIEVEFEYFFKRYAHYQTHTNEREFPNFWELSLMIYAKFVESYGMAKVKNLNPLQFMSMDEDKYPEWTAVIIKQFLDFIDESAAQAS